MSKAVKTVVAVVAAVAIPFAAPAIASSIGLSAAIGTAVGSATAGSVIGGALTGAVLGGASAAITGGDVGRGALMGGIGGGIGGYTAAPTAATAPTTAAAPTLATGQGAFLGEGIASGVPAWDAAAQTAGLTLTTPPAPLTMMTPVATTYPVAPQAVITPTTTPMLGQGAFLGEGVASGVPSFDAAAQNAGLTLTTPPSPIMMTPTTTPMLTAAPTGNGAFLGEGIASGVPSWDAAAQNAGLTLTTPPAPITMMPTTTYPTTGVVGEQGAFLGEGVASGVPEWDAAARGAGVPLTTPPAPLPSVAPTTFAEALAKVPGEIAAKFSDPKALADLTLRAGGMLAGSAIAGDGLSSEERALLQAQTDELRMLQQTNRALFDQRLQQAQNLIGESKYFDPEYFGLQRARRAQLAGAKAKRAGLRGLTGSAREAESRRFDLAIGRDVGSAFDQGYMSGVQGRLGTMQAGLNMMPSSFPSSMGDYTNLRGAYGSAAERARQTQRDIGELFGSLTGGARSGSKGP